MLDANEDLSEGGALNTFSRVGLCKKVMVNHTCAEKHNFKLMIAKAIKARGSTKFDGH